RWWMWSGVERVVSLCVEAEGGIRDWSVTGVQTCALPICHVYFDVVALPVAREIALRVLEIDVAALVAVRARDAPREGARPGVHRSEERRVGKERRCGGGAGD